MFYIRIATGSKNRYARRKKKVDIEALIEFRRNRSDFVQNQCRRTLHAKRACTHMLQNFFNLARGGACTRRRRLMGERLVRCRAGIYPPAFFSPGPADPIPPYDGGGGRRGNNNMNDTMASCRGPVPSSRPGQFG